MTDTTLDFVGRDDGFFIGNMIFASGNAITFVNAIDGTDSLSAGGGSAPVAFTPSTGSPTAVPFGVDPTSGLFLLGGIWGIAKLNKKWKNRKIADDLSV